jgi:hypothetical protein
MIQSANGSCMAESTSTRPRYPSTKPKICIAERVLSGGTMLRTSAPIKPLAISMILYNGTMSAVGGRTRTRMMAYKNGRFHQALVRDSA